MGSETNKILEGVWRAAVLVSLMTILVMTIPITQEWGLGVIGIYYSSAATTLFVNEYYKPRGGE